MNLTLQEYLDLLDSAETAAGVAKLLRSYGVRGDRYSAHNCPIARLGSELCGQPIEANCGQPYIGYAEYIDDEGGREVPEPYVRQFMEAFDEGEVPDLSLPWRPRASGS